MPRFDFRCTACETVFEETIPFDAKKMPACPSCGRTKTEKLLSAPMGIVFKGTGFYKTDSRSSSGASKKSVEAKPETPKPEASALAAKPESPKAGA